MKQLQLPTEKLLKIGFEKKIYRYMDIYSKKRKKVIYEIPCVNGCFYYNEKETEYKWYQRITIGNHHNYIHLNIEKIEELYTVLLCFNVKFNYKTLLS